MSSFDRHADHEALSGLVDGEAPEWADHVAACATCQASATELRAVASAVGAPVDGPPAAVREAAIAAALSANLPAAIFPAAAASPAPTVTPTSAGHAAEGDRFARRRMTLPSWAMPAVAAVVVGLLGISGFLVASGNRSTDETTTLAGPSLESDAKPGSGGLAAATPVIPATDLGDLPDAATLLARTRTGVPGAVGSTAAARSSASSAGASTDSAAGGAALNATGGSGGSSVASGAASGGAGGAVSPNVVGTRPCEQEARTREPGLGPVGYFATARKGGVEGYVLGFNSPGGPTPVTLLLLAQNGCRELLRVAGP